ncbi:hypothetical protein [Seonamhaeicola aphaedonensis]|uniref:Spy/CpxP family protein refolding chaperone n=1 Tax=Seonamhaeicola aphaedonensis TaxID=1461338 RepID=A0A3D9HJ18_9FLAO|nr:hypothetical protein [Seonamhaeicola aphaedonensis]RED49425.1 hypothetical protein DFQ02_102197 [Seonamhaeicola aphaedonensis]
MKYFLILFSCFISLSLYAQKPDGGVGFQRGSQSVGPAQGDGFQGQRPTKFDPYKSAGIVYHDVGSVIKKLKIKNDKELKQSVEKVISDYNDRLKEISLENKTNFDTLNIYMNSTIKLLMLNGGDTNKMQEVRTSVRDKIKPVRQMVMNEERNLHKTVTGLLDEKQLKRWKNYMKEFKTSSRPQRNGEQRPSGNSPGNFQRGLNQQGAGSQGRQGFGGANRQR